MRWIFLLMAVLLVAGCIGGMEASEDIGDLEDSPDYTQVDTLPDGEMHTEEELGSDIGDEELF